MHPGCNPDKCTSLGCNPLDAWLPDAPRQKTDGKQVGGMHPTRMYTFISFISSTKRVVELPGGLAEEVTEKVIHAAFIPFGDLMDIQIPLDYETGMFLSSIVLSVITLPIWNKITNTCFCILIPILYHFLEEKHRGFAFVEFELAEVR